MNIISAFPSITSSTVFIPDPKLASQEVQHSSNEFTQQNLIDEMLKKTVDTQLPLKVFEHSREFQAILHVTGDRKQTWSSVYDHTLVHLRYGSTFTHPVANFISSAHHLGRDKETIIANLMAQGVCETPNVFGLWLSQAYVAAGQLVSELFDLGYYLLNEEYNFGYYLLNASDKRISYLLKENFQELLWGSAVAGFVGFLGYGAYRFRDKIQSGLNYYRTPFRHPLDLPVSDEQKRGMKILDNSSLDNLFLCPITLSVMRNPILASDHHHYDYHSLFDEKGRLKLQKSPLDRTKLEEKKFLNDSDLRSKILDMAEAQARKTK